MQFHTWPFYISNKKHNSTAFEYNTIQLLYDIPGIVHVEIVSPCGSTQFVEGASFAAAEVWGSWGGWRKKSGSLFSGIWHVKMSNLALQP